jgi:putative DNA primase/helicase
MSEQILSAALAWHAAGCAVVPVRPDGTKAPAVNWRQYQDQRPTVEQLHAWFTDDTFDGLGLISGRASGGLELLELEGRAVHAGAIAVLDQHAADNGLDDLLTAIAHGCAVTSPSGGLHLLYRVTDGARPNTKLARRLSTPQEFAAAPGARLQVLAETRGEGGFIVAAPSGGRTHPTGRPWTLTSGSPHTILTITGEQRDALHALVHLLDEEPPREDTTALARTLPGLPGATAGTRPGDDFNARATWDDILTPHGWTTVRRMGRGYAWRRPGKNEGISATTGQSTDGADRLYVFTTSTEFESERPYDKLGAYALLEHAGDLTAAVRALAKAGYGTPPQQSTSGSPVADTRPARTEVVHPSPEGTQGAVDDSPAVQPEVAHPALTVDEPQPTTLAMSDDGHAQMLIAEFATSIRHIDERARWLHWDGWRWQPQPSSGGIVREYAKFVGRKMPSSKQWETAKRRALSAPGTAACLAQAATDPRVAVSQTHLDARPWELNTPGGIVDLRTGVLTAADPAKLHTKVTTATPDPDADPTVWLQFLTTTFQGDAELIGWMHRLLGYACIGVVRENILPVFYGATGANGKTVLLDTVMTLLGDYAGPAPRGFLLQGPRQHDTEVADLAGIRMLVSSETNSGERFDEGKVKLLTGGDMLKARFMRQDYFRFVPSHTIFLMSNHRPEVTSGGDAFWRRVREVPFDHQVPVELRDPELKDRLVTEHGPAIMAWLTAGAAEYARTGLAEPERVKAATTDYARDTDTVAQFIDEACLVGGIPILVTKVRVAYEQFCLQIGSQPVSPKAFTQALHARYGVAVSRSNGKRFYDSLTLLDTSEGTLDDTHGGNPWT